MKKSVALLSVLALPMSVVLAETKQFQTNINIEPTLNTQSLINAEYQPHSIQAEIDPTQLRGSALFFEDFQSETIPAGWVLINNDGLTPIDADFDQAWQVRNEQADTNSPNFTAASNSWYSPPGTADDWLITPAIAIGDDATLSWLAASWDVAPFQDSYEVYISTSTQDMAGCMANAAVFSIAAEVSGVLTPRSVDLAFEGFSNTSIHVCFRNNSNDRYVLEVDDIWVEGTSGITNDVSIVNASVPEYTAMPISFAYVSDIMTIDIQNNGSNSQSNMNLNIQIAVDGKVEETADIAIVGTVEPGNTLTADVSQFGVLTGPYDVIYTVNLDGVSDETPENNTTTIPNFIIGDGKVAARDDGTVIGALSIGLGDGGQIGQVFTVPEAAVLESVFFAFQNATCDAKTAECGLDNLDIVVEIYNTDEFGVPTTVLATAESFTVPPGIATYTPIQDVVGGPLTLSAGTYAFIINEPVDPNPSDALITRLGLFFTGSRITPGTSWLNSPTIPSGTWTNAEDFGFPNPLLVRPVFVDPDVIFEDGFE